MVFKATWTAFWLTLLGLSLVYLQVVQVRTGDRVHRTISELEAIEEKLRRLELRYNRLVSPDVLEKDLQEFYEGDEELTEA